MMRRESMSIDKLLAEHVACALGLKPGTGTCEA